MTLFTESAILAAARELGITRITFFERDDDECRWHSWRDRRHSGASGPRLDDLEAAVLIASGIPWSVYGYPVGGWSNEEIAARKADGVGGGASHTEKAGLL